MVDLLLCRVEYKTMPLSGQEISALCAKIASLDDNSPEFWQKVSELRTALHGHLATLRDDVADLALRIAASEESKAAD